VRSSSNRLRRGVPVGGLLSIRHLSPRPEGRTVPSRFVVRQRIPCCAVGISSNDSHDP
jgi:hypothetical protein